MVGFWAKKTVIALGLGQVVSLLITSTGFSSSELSRRGINAPTSQSFLNYVLLAIVYGSILIHRKKALQIKWYYYFMLAIVDVEANFLGFATIDHIETNANEEIEKKRGGSNLIKGDLLVIGGSMLYAVSNVSEEFLVKKADRIELMTMLGSFGAVVSACQISILEHHELRSIHWTAGAVLPFIRFAVAMFLFYSLVPVLLKISGSTMLNLSLLTSDMWAVFIRIFAYHEKVDWMYFIAFATVAVGLVIYSGGAKQDNETRDQAEGMGVEPNERDEETGLNNSAQGSKTGSQEIREKCLMKNNSLFVARKGPYYICSSTKCDDKEAAPLLDDNLVEKSFHLAQ
ncbi:uncharacterized protein LOC143890033 isoform X3 [Tasmannia lanceolata]|uniref:uncharacterized protein LOC143890033 isoform X3 n=1 Tax=Tasmannia lanceolata TaxID=3420 RepID=UPI0040639C5B